MSNDNETVASLRAFKDKDKFSASAWGERGLIPSNSEMCSDLSDLFNGCADDLVVVVQRNGPPRELKKILRMWLSRFRRMDYDTAESEFICDYFQDLAEIVNVDFNANLNRWLYGVITAMLDKFFRLFAKPDKPIGSIAQRCTGCGAKLEILVLQKKGWVPACWHIAKCAGCGEYALFYGKPGIGMHRYENCSRVEELGIDEYPTEDAARARMNQIKLFRKDG